MEPHLRIDLRTPTKIGRTWRSFRPSPGPSPSPSLTTRPSLTMYYVRGVMQAPRSHCTLDPHTPVGGKLQRVFLPGLCPVGSLRHSTWPYHVIVYYTYIQLGHVTHMGSPAYCRAQRIGRCGTIVVYLHIKKSTLIRRA